ncbi:MAG: CopG family ribbon-helix-helix protein [Candidatus Thioglobus sp.]|uniref:CopG family ribbon-helix-helix protein n=1 Tax=Candidatus Thioglobus sp. TaxID=2026721 RepID=UPI00260CD6AB|nr:CopG family ribbon-helix-helix protein [Candidatus Thioglobus sp.]MDC9727594.1 CopG family ribbon-helix-helix protein [Candidatus Thioglobus sp.]
MGVTSIRLNSDIEKPLADLTKKLDRSKNYLINQAVKEFVARQKMEQDRWQDTLEALDDVKNGRFINANKVDKWLDSWGSDNELPTPTA